MPYLTPEEIPESTTCRALLIPDSPEWLAIFSGALTELLMLWNWQQEGAVTVDQAIEVATSVIDQYYEEPCATCDLPEGGSIIRLAPGGHIEVLEDGEWVTPTEGDYYIPPPEAREGGTEEDQICLAAKNATEVLRQLYEQLSEDWAEEVAEGEALLAFAAIFTGVVGFAIAPITFGIYAFFAPIFALIYAGLEYLTADLWDEQFTKQITCFLVECAANDSGVVTFDWECFNGKLNSLVDEFGLSEVQIRLYLQIAYMLSFIGGVDGLNLAGATTSITDDNCDGCGDRWCEIVDFVTSDGGFVSDTVFGTGATYTPGVGWVYYDAGGTSGTYIRRDSIPFANWDYITFKYNSTGHVTDVVIYAEDSAVATIYQTDPAEVGTDQNYNWLIGTPVTLDMLALQIGNQTGGGAEGTSVIVSAEFHGPGEGPGLWDDCS